MVMRSGCMLRPGSANEKADILRGKLQTSAGMKKPNKTRLLNRF
jgi:hypothetical protein